MVKAVLPGLGEGIKSATLSYWYFKPGEKVAQNNDLVEFATDKATFNLPSPCSGTLSKIFFQEGDTVNVGDAVAEIEEG